MPAKKSTAKPKTTKSKKTKKTAAPHEYFFLADGRAAKSIKELAFMLDDISHDVFGHHVSDAKNDFANWVESVFDERDLAELMRIETEISKLQLQLLRHLANKYA